MVGFGVRQSQVQIFAPYSQREYSKLLYLPNLFPHTSVLWRIVDIEVDQVCEVPGTEEACR